MHCVILGNWQPFFEPLCLHLCKMSTSQESNEIIYAESLYSFLSLEDSEWLFVSLVLNSTTTNVGQ